MAPMNNEFDYRTEQDRDTEVVTGSVVDGEGGIYLTVRDEAFEIRRVSISYPMMKFAQARRKAEVHIPKHLPEDDPRRKKAEATRNAAGMEIMALLLDATQILLKPNERDRFDSYMMELSMTDEGLKPGELEEAISQAMAAVGEVEEGKQESTSSTSSNGSPKTSQNVRVISSRKVTREDGLPMTRPANSEEFVHDAT